MILIGRTLRIRDRSNNIEYKDTAQIQVNIGLETIDVPRGKRQGFEVIPYDQPVTGIMGWADINPDIIAAHTGSTKELGSGQNYIDKLTISGNTCTVKHKPIAVNSSYVVVGETEYNIVDAGDEVSGVSCSVDLATGIFTFKAGDPATSCEIEYVGLDVSTGYKIEISPWDFPDEFDLLMACDGAKSGDITLGNFLVFLYNVQLKGTIEAGVEVGGNYAKFTREFNVANRNKGDVSLMFPPSP